jgi:hypothetical protein
VDGVLSTTGWQGGSKPLGFEGGKLQRTPSCGAEPTLDVSVSSKSVNVVLTGVYSATTDILDGSASWQPGTPLRLHQAVV